jgi:hypothetical protein
MGFFNIISVWGRHCGAKKPSYATDYVRMSSSGVTLMSGFVKILSPRSKLKIRRTDGKDNLVSSLIFFLSLILSVFETVMCAINAVSDSTNNFGDCLQARSVYIGVHVYAEAPQTTQ